MGTYPSHCGRPLLRMSLLRPQTLQCLNSYVFGIRSGIPHFCTQIAAPGWRSIDICLCTSLSVCLYVCLCVCLGAGKSTLLNTLTGRIAATSGHVTLNGQPIRRQLRRKISYVVQQDVFYPLLTLRETLNVCSLTYLLTYLFTYCVRWLWVDRTACSIILLSVCLSVCLPICPSCNWLSVTLCIVANRNILLQKCLNMWIGSAPGAQFYNFQLYTEPQSLHLLHHRRWCHLANTLNHTYSCVTNLDF